MATRAKKPAPKTKSSLTKLAAALDFVAIASNDTGLIHEQHCVFHGQAVYASNGTLSAAHPVEEDFTSVPHLKTLRKAIAKTAKDALSIVAEESRLTITAGRLRVAVPSLALQNVPPIMGDMQPRYPVTPEADLKLREALAAVADAVTDAPGAPVNATAVLLENAFVMATNHAFAIQAYHGIAFPRVLVPKIFVKELLKVSLQIEGFGVGVSKVPGMENNLTSLTVFFVGGLWLKTQLFDETAYPDLSRLDFDAALAAATPPVEGFWDAFDAVAPFANEERGEHRIGFTPAGMKCGAATYQILGLPEVRLNPLYIGLARNHMLRVNWTASNGRAVAFSSGNVRGMIAHVVDNAPIQNTAPEYTPMDYTPPPPAFEIDFSKLNAPADPSEFGGSDPQD